MQTEYLVYKEMPHLTENGWSDAIEQQIYCWILEHFLISIRHKFQEIKKKKHTEFTTTEMLPGN